MAYEGSSFTLLTTQAAGKVSHCAHISAMCTLWLHAVKEKAADKYILNTYTIYIGEFYGGVSDGAITIHCLYLFQMQSLAVVIICPTEYMIFHLQNQKGL